MTAIGRRAGFYGFLLSGNVLVGLMFSVVHTPLPVIRTEPVVIVAKEEALPPATTGVPSRLFIKQLGLNLMVEKGSYDPDTATWTTGDDRAYYADVSLPANDSNGVTLIYGHARSSVFARLAELRPNTQLALRTTNDKVFIYTFTSMREVMPTDVSVFTAAGSPRLVLQTCSGPWDKYRALYTFKFTQVRSV